METTQQMHRTLARGAVRVDTERRRMWVGRQRLHHGLTGVVLAAAGIVLMAHDWHDRSVWFERGPQH
jgi:hypothetical protein